MIDWVRRFIWRPTSSGIQDAHAGGVIELVQRCTWRLGLGQSEDAAANDFANMERILDRCWRYNLNKRLTVPRDALARAVMVWACKFAWRPWSSEFGNTFGSHHQANSEIMRMWLSQSAFRLCLHKSGYPHWANDGRNWEVVMCLFGDIPVRQDCKHWERNLEAMIGWNRRSSLRCSIITRSNANCNGSWDSIHS